MFHIGTAGMPLACKGTETVRALECIKSLNLSALEIAFTHGIYLNREKAREIFLENKKHNIKLSIHAPYTINLSSLNPNVLRQSTESMIKCLELADILNASPVVFHPGYFSGRSKADALAVLKKSLADITWRGFSAKVGVETMGSQSKIGTLDEVIDICREVKGTMPVIDFAHIHAHGNGALKTEKDFRNIFERLEKELGTKTFHCHMTCVKYENGNEKYHLPLDAFEPDFRVLANILTENKYNITVVSESPILEEDAFKFIRWLDEARQ